jgi:hypothetical protein
VPGRLSMRAKWPGWDCALRDDPPSLPAHVGKLFFLRRRAGAAQPPAVPETLGIGWSEVRALPPLSLSAVSIAASSDERWPATVTLPAR